MSVGRMGGDVLPAALRVLFYWYNFMPLARGTAAVGYTALLGLLLAGGREVTAPIPPNTQVDWEVRAGGCGCVYVQLVASSACLCVHEKVQ